MTGWNYDSDTLIVFVSEAAEKILRKGGTKGAIVFQFSGSFDFHAWAANEKTDGGFDVVDAGCDILSAP